MVIRTLVLKLFMELKQNHNYKIAKFLEIWVYHKKVIKRQHGHLGGKRSSLTVWTHF